MTSVRLPCCFGGAEMFISRASRQLPKPVAEEPVMFGSSWGLKEEQISQLQRAQMCHRDSIVTVNWVIVLKIGIGQRGLHLCLGHRIRPLNS